MNPTISVIIPCFNEEALIECKIQNILGQDYEGRLDIIIVDGGSTDKTLDIVKYYIDCYWKEQGPKLDDRILRLEKAPKGKTHQVNEGIHRTIGEIIFVTDVDAVMEPGCIRTIVEEFSNPNVAVVGACSVPDKAVFLDPLCWRVSNFIRCLQSRICTAPWVIATCYAFRKNLLSEYPDDVIADDAYFPLWANFKGYKTIYTDKTTVREVRNPTSWRQFFYHKHRKANALLREFTRFSYLMPYARPGWKVLFMTWFAFLILVAGWSYPFFKQDSCYRKTV
ncbi:MAG: glycosyltransferase [Candidatus Omnitrophota bacterium]|jgi:cellulose synthase/poly-beta-1,6-N-acetylglucosamine synthase-like glycosyltransferase